MTDAGQNAPGRPRAESPPTAGLPWILPPRRAAETASQPFCEETPDGRLWFCHKCPREYQTGFRTRQEVRDHRNSGACRAPPNSRRGSDVPGLYSPGKRGSRPGGDYGPDDFSYDSGDDGFARAAARPRAHREPRPLDEFVVDAPPRPRARRERREDESADADGDEIETLHADDDDNGPDASALADRRARFDPDDDDDRESRARRSDFAFDDDASVDRERGRARYTSLDDELSVGDGDERAGPKRAVPTQQCPHCFKLVHTNGANYTRHVDACQRNAGGEPSPHKGGPPPKPPLAACPLCHKMVHTNGANYRRHVEACTGIAEEAARARPAAPSGRPREAVSPSEDPAPPAGHFLLLPDVIAECMVGRPEGASLEEICRAVEKVWARIRKPDGSRYKHDLKYTVSNTLTIHNGRFRRAGGNLFALKDGHSSSNAPSPPLPDAFVPERDRDDLPIDERVRRQRALVAEARQRLQRESSRLVAWERQLAVVTDEADAFAAEFSAALSTLEAQVAAAEAERQAREAESWVQEWESRLEHLKGLLGRFAARRGLPAPGAVKQEPGFAPIETAERLRREADGEVADAVSGNPSPPAAVPGSEKTRGADGEVPLSGNTSRADSASPPSTNDGHSYPPRSRSSSPHMRAPSPDSPPAKRARRLEETGMEQGPPGAVAIGQGAVASA
eukprot:tig00020572_g11550.t1